jgi:hypothetical protein
MFDLIFYKNIFNVLKERYDQRLDRDILLSNRTCFSRNNFFRDMRKSIDNKIKFRKMMCANTNTNDNLYLYVNKYVSYFNPLIEN